MPRTNPEADVTAVNLRCLTQAQASALTGKPAHWFRDNPQIVDSVRFKPPGKARYHYDGPALVQLLVASSAPEEGANNAELRRRGEELKLRKVEIETEREEWELRRKMGDLVSRSTTVALVSRILSSYTETLMRVPEDLGSLLPAEIRDDTTELLRSGVERALIGLSEELQRKVATVETSQ